MFNESSTTIFKWIKHNMIQSASDYSTNFLIQVCMYVYSNTFTVDTEYNFILFKRDSNKMWMCSFHARCILLNMKECCFADRKPVDREETRAFYRFYASRVCCIKIHEFHCRCRVNRKGTLLYQLVNTWHRCRSSAPLTLCTTMPVLYVNEYTWLKLILLLDVYWWITSTAG